MNYKVVVHESEEGFSVSCPGLPGCWSQGATEAEALENIQDAIRDYLAAIDDLVRAMRSGLWRRLVSASCARVSM
ncbi:MAG: HicB family protein [Acidobacteria bacterium]|nr:MAG: HicB family protein [Acidobacteriota bacterium]